MTQAIKNLYGELREADYHYYVKNTSIMPDAEYDKKKKLLKEFEDKIGIPENSRFSKTLGLITPTGDRAVKRVSQYKSVGMNDAFDVEEGIDRLAKFGLDPKTGKVHCSNKHDGLTARLFYQNGTLIQVLTRGDGETGEDVTAAFINRVENSESYIYLKEFSDIDSIIEIRGEVTVTWAETEKHGYSSARSFASGSLRSENKEDNNRVLLFHAFDLLSKEVIEKFSLNDRTELYALLETIGFLTPNFMVLELKDFEKAITEKWEAKTAGIGFTPFPLDGLVIAIHDLRQYLDHEENRFALKFKENEHAVKVLSISHQVGRTGKLTPVATTEEWISADGGKNTSATLHNYVKWEDAGVGSIVKVIKSGAVIPKVVSVFSVGERLLPPIVCPCCKSKIFSYLNGHFCSSILSDDVFCLDIFKRKLVNFCETLGVKGLGEESAAEVAKYLSMGSIFNAKLSDFIRERYNLKLVLGKNGEKLTEQLDRLAGNVTNAQLLESVSFDNIGEFVSKEVCSRYSLVDDLTSEYFDFSSLRSIQGIGDIIIDGLKNELSLERNRNLIIELADYLKPIDKRIEVKNDSPIKDYSIVITGAFIGADGEEVARHLLSDYLKGFGATLKSSVSKKTNLLIVGREPGVVKIKDAEANGVKIVTTAEFLELVK